MTSQGVLMFAHNNQTVDYIKQSIFAAMQVKKYLQMPVTLITSNQAHLYMHYKKHIKIFDKVIPVEEFDTIQTRDFYNGAENKINDLWKKIIFDPQHMNCLHMMKP